MKKYSNQDCESYAKQNIFLTVKLALSWLICGHTQIVLSRVVVKLGQKLQFPLLREPLWDSKLACARINSFLAHALIQISLMIGFRAERGGRKKKRRQPLQSAAPWCQSGLNCQQLWAVACARSHGVRFITGDQPREEGIHPSIRPILIPHLAGYCIQSTYTGIINNSWRAFTKRRRILQTDDASHSPQGVCIFACTFVRSAPEMATKPFIGIYHSAPALKKTRGRVRAPDLHQAD